MVTEVYSVVEGKNAKDKRRCAREILNKEKKIRAAMI